MRTHKIWNFLRTVLERLKEKLRSAGLLLVRCSCQPLDTLLIGCMFLVLSASKVKVAERPLFVEAQAANHPSGHVSNLRDNEPTTVESWSQRFRIRDFSVR